MNRCTRTISAAAAVVLALALGLSVGWAQPGPQAPAAGPEEYHYVGLQQTMARVHLRTGAIDILVREGETRVGLGTPGGRPWSWRSVRMSERESTARRPAPRSMPDEPDEPNSP